MSRANYRVLYVLVGNGEDNNGGLVRKAQVERFHKLSIVGI